VKAGTSSTRKIANYQVQCQNIVGRKKRRWHSQQREQGQSFSVISKDIWKSCMKECTGMLGTYDWKEKCLSCKTQHGKMTRRSPAQASRGAGEVKWITTGERLAVSLTINWSGMWSPKTKRARPNWNGSADAGMNSDPLSSKTNPSYKQVNKEVETCVQAYELLGMFSAPQQCTTTGWNQP